MWSNKKVVFIHNTTKYVFLHYREFIEKFVQAGASVVVIAPFDDTVNQIQALGAQCIDIKLSRQGLNPIFELATLFDLYRLLGEEKPDLVFNYSIKPVIYGSIAARWRHVGDIFSMVTGLGHLFMDQGAKYKMIRSIIFPLYRTALRGNKAVFFQNPDDKTLFIEYDLLPDDKGFVVNGTGIDLEEFQPVDLRDRPTTFILVSRLLWSKGIREFVEAARILKKRHSEARFQVLGMFDDNPSSIKRSQLEAWQREGVIEYLGATEDVRPFVNRASVFVLPTIYREGRPRAVVEAMAMGKPIITTDTPGCRQTVIEGHNGFLVPVKDVPALAKTMERFINSPRIIKSMGECSRKMAQEQYDVHNVNDAIESVILEKSAL